MNPWLAHVSDYKNKHPGMAYKDVLVNAKKTYKGSGSKTKKTVKKVVPKVNVAKVKVAKVKVVKKKGKGVVGDVGGVVNSVSGLTNSIGDQVDKGRRTTQEFNKENGYLEVEKKRNKGNEEKEFQKFYRDLIHDRYWDPEKLPPRLRLPFDRKFINDPKYKARRDLADEKLYAYAEKAFNRA